jgi:hypothetical protein
VWGRKFWGGWRAWRSETCRCSYGFCAGGEGFPLGEGFGELRFGKGSVWNYSLSVPVSLLRNVGAEAAAAAAAVVVVVVEKRRFNDPWYNLGRGPSYRTPLSPIRSRPTLGPIRSLSLSLTHIIPLSTRNEGKKREMKRNSHRDCPSTPAKPPKRPLLSKKPPRSGSRSDRSYISPPPRLAPARRETGRFSSRASAGPLFSLPIPTCFSIIIIDSPRGGEIPVVPPLDVAVA